MNDEDTRPNLAELGAQVVSALTDLRITLYGVSIQVQQLRRRVEEGTPQPGAVVVPQLSDAHPEWTPHGSKVQLVRDEWDKLASRMAALEQEKELEKARADGASEALTQLEQRSTKRLQRSERKEKRNLYLLAFVGPVTALVSWLLTHVHL